MAWVVLIGCFAAPVTGGATRPAARLPAVLEVACDGTAPFLTIADAIDEAHSGDTVRIAPCSYFGAIDPQGRTLRIEGTGGAAVTTVYATPGRPVLDIDDGEGPGMTVAGLTLTGGGGVDDAAIEVDFANLRLEDCVVTGNAGIQALHARSSRTEVVRTVFTANGGTEGMVVYGQRGFLHWKDSTLRCDGVGKGVESSHGGLLVDGGTLTCPGAVAFHNEHSVGRFQRVVAEGRLELVGEFGNTDLTVVENSTILGNVVVDTASVELRNSVLVGGALVLDGAGDGSIEGNIFAQSPCGVDGSSLGSVVRNNAFFDVSDPHCGSNSDYVGENGNIAADPLFVDLAAGNLRLSAGSPCVDAGPDGAAYLDVDGTRNDMGVYGGPFTQAGGW